MTKVTESVEWRPGGAGKGLWRCTLLSMVLVLFTVSGAAREVPRIAVGEWPPYLSAELPGLGIAARIATEAFAREGITVAYEFYPWARALAMTKAGNVAASLLWVRTADRETDYLFTDVVISGTAVFFHLKSQPMTWKTTDDLEHLTIGGLRSASYPWFEKANGEGKNLKMILSTNEVDNFHHLLDKDIDVFSLDLLAGVWFMRRGLQPAERILITWNPKPIEKWDYRLMVSRKWPGSAALVKSFNHGLAKLKADGTWHRMIDEYLAGKAD